MGKEFIEFAFDQKLFDKFVKELPERSKAYQRHVVLELTKRAKDNVVAKAPSDPNLMDYQKELDVYRYRDFKNPKFAILYDRAVESGAKLSSETTLLTIRPTRRNPGAIAPVLNILKEFQPFTLNTWPVKIPRDKAWIIYKDVKDSGIVKRAEMQNKRDMPSIIRKLQATKFRLRASDFRPPKDDLEVMSGIALEVVRAELGISRKKHSHWRPAIRELETEINKIMMSKESIMTLAAANYKRWTKLGLISKTASDSTELGIQSFQKAILNQ